MTNNDATDSHAAKFMLQEHSRMIDVYQDLHVQKNELLKIYLAFASIPVSIIAIFLSLYRYLSQTPGLNDVLGAFQKAAVCLSILLITVGIAVLMILLKIRGEQYLYVQAVNGTRKFFKEQSHIDPAYLVLPFDPNQFTFAEEELNGRPFWEAMIVSFTTSLLLAFVFAQAAQATGWFTFCQACLWVLTAEIFVISSVCLAFFIRSKLKRAMKGRGLTDLSAALPATSVQAQQSASTSQTQEVEKPDPDQPR